MEKITINSNHELLRLVTLVMEKIEEYGFQSPGGVLGFLTLLGIVFVILALCLFIGAGRELLLGRADKKISEWVEKFLSVFMHLKIG